MKLFHSFRDWKDFLLSSVNKVFVGILRILWSFIGGVISIIVNTWRSTTKFCRREFGAAFVIGVIILLLITGWIFSFSKERSARVYAESQRDSLSLKLDSTKQNPTNHWECDNEDW